MQHPSPSSSPSTHLVFIDSSIKDVDTLISDIIKNANIVVLHPSEDGISQITTALADRSPLVSIHILAHGRPGQLRLGNTVLSIDSLKAYQSQLQHWRKALHPKATLLLYGCHVAEGDRGKAFIDQLKQILGIEVAASSTAIGAASKGGNWQLDVTTADFAPVLAVRSQEIAYASILAETYLDEPFSGSTITLPPGWTNVVLAGNAAVDRWRLDNPGNRALPDFLTPPAAIFDSDRISNNDQPENVALTSPIFNASGETQLFLQFDQDYEGTSDPVYGSKGYVELFNGTSWQTVATQEQDVTGTTRLDISNVAAGVSNAQVRFRWTGNWSFYWAVDNVKVVDALTSGVTYGNPALSEDSVPDTRNFQFTLNSKPTSNVTINFAVDPTQLQAVSSLTFTPQNWNVPQAATVIAVQDGIAEGSNQKSPIKISIASADPNYNNLTIQDATATITDNTIPGFPSYRTVEETYRDMAALATANPTLVTWKDIGDSYDKVTPGGAPGYDLYALELTNSQKQIPGRKPVLYVEAGLHAREYSTNEVAARFAENLINSYGIHSDMTWLLDYYRIVVVPVVNPDGRKFAEQGYSWRKNTNPNPSGTFPTATFPNYGVDLNRNHTFEWSTVSGGSSPDPSAEEYRGAAPGSEPETQAIETYVKTLFRDRKGAAKNSPASPNTSGVFIDLHSFGNSVLYPWGSTKKTAPNSKALRTLGTKFGYYTNANGTPYDIYQSVGLYPTDGSTDDWAYGTLGVAAFTWELGTTFFEPSDYFERSISQQVIAALTYAAKASRLPYQTPAAPESTNVEVDRPQVAKGISVTITAKADDTRYADSNTDGLKEGTKLPESQNITAACYSIDSPSWVRGTKNYAMIATDGVFDEKVESLTATIDTRRLSPGRHTIFVESRDSSGGWGVPTAIFLEVVKAPRNARSVDGNDRANVINGRSRSDVIYAFGGNDRLRANAGKDFVFSGDGNDMASGDDGDDLLYGGVGRDSMNGGAGNDKLYGDAGNDQLVGGAGDDRIWGGAGRDTTTGNAGKDTFVLAYTEGTDQITDFVTSEDLIGLAGTLTYGQLSLVQSGAATLVKFGGSILAQLQGVTASSLTAAHFMAIASI